MGVGWGWGVGGGRGGCLKGLVRAALRKHSRSDEQGWAVHPRLLSPQRTGSRFDGMLESEEKFKACLSIESKQAKEKWPQDKKTDGAKAFSKEWRKREKAVH